MAGVLAAAVFVAASLLAHTACESERFINAVLTGPITLISWGAGAGVLGSLIARSDRLTQRQALLEERERVATDLQARLLSAFDLVAAALRSAGTSPLGDVRDGLERARQALERATEGGRRTLERLAHADPQPQAVHLWHGRQLSLQVATIVRWTTLAVAPLWLFGGAPGGPIAPQVAMLIGLCCWTSVVLVALRAGAGWVATWPFQLVDVTVTAAAGAAYGTLSPLMAQAVGAIVTTGAVGGVRRSVAAGVWSVAVYGTVVLTVEGGWSALVANDEVSQFMFCSITLLLWGLASGGFMHLADRNERLVRGAAAAEVRDRALRDLHDRVLADATTAMMLMHELASDPRQGDPRIAHLARQLTTAAQAGRAVLRGTAPECDDLTIGLADLVRSLGALAPQRRIVLRTEGDPPPLSAQGIADVIGIAREGIVNALRHSAPGVIEVEGIWVGPQWVLEVRDPGGAIAVPPVGTRYGLAGVRQRAERLGADLHIDFGTAAGRLCVGLPRRTDPAGR